MGYIGCGWLRHKKSDKNIKEVYTIVLIMDHTLPVVSPQEEGACWEGPAGKLEAWLTFISSDRSGDILRVFNTYPEFRELYKEVFEFRYQKKELISMYSEALRILDTNTIEYMAEQQRKQIRRLNKKLEQEVRRLTALLNEKQDA
ncbi:MAG: hypothetical protein HFG74_04115 [Hungatella sp.]|nr:hypothetical protein [Hungatella sp.]